MFCTKAVVINENTMDLIADANDGVRPDAGEDTNFFVIFDDADQRTEIRSLADLVRDFVLPKNTRYYHQFVTLEQ